MPAGWREGAEVPVRRSYPFPLEPGYTRAAHSGVLRGGRSHAEPRENPLLKEGLVVLPGAQGEDVAHQAHAWVRVPIPLARCEGEPHLPLQVPLEVPPVVVREREVGMKAQRGMESDPRRLVAHAGGVVRQVP